MPEISTTISAVCAQIKRIRNKKSLSQQEVAARLYISQTSYSQMEAGKRKIDIERVAALAKLFDVPVSYFFEALPEGNNKKKTRNEK